MENNSFGNMNINMIKIPKQGLTWLHILTGPPIWPKKCNFHMCPINMSLRPNKTQSLSKENGISKN